MNLERYHLVRAHERVKEAADELQGAIVTRPRPQESDSYFRQATKQLESAIAELGGRIVWDGADTAGAAE